jgi:hypothetical protein
MSAALEQTERAADRIRGELMSTLQELDRRRHLAFDLRYQTTRHRTAIALVAVGALAIAGALTAALIRARQRRKSLFSARIRGVVRAWENPDRIARDGKDQRLAPQVARKLAVALAAALATQLGKQSMRRILPAPPR